MDWEALRRLYQALVAVAPASTGTFPPDSSRVMATTRSATADFIKKEMARYADVVAFSSPAWCQAFLRCAAAVVGAMITPIVTTSAPTIPPMLRW